MRTLLFALYVLVALAVVVLSGIVVWASLLLGPRLVVAIGLGLATLIAFAATIFERHDLAAILYLASAALWLFVWSHGPLTLLPGLLIFLGMMMASSYFAFSQPRR